MLEKEYNPFLLNKFKEIFNKRELPAFLKANEEPRPVTIRINTLMKRRKEVVKSLEKRRIETGELPWTDHALVCYKSQNPIGATPEYLAGQYIIQGANSMLPVLNMNLEQGLKVADLCAAPGGKSTHIAALMNNTGTLFCNEIDKDRLFSLKSNLQRMGVTNTICTNLDALKFEFGKFDRVLLDAPCSGTGVIAKDPSIKTSKSLDELKEIRTLQKSLILKAYDMLKTEGYLMYSTCSVLVDENEKVVQHLLTNRVHAQIAELKVSVGKDGFTRFRQEDFSGHMSRAKRIYPHVHNMDGFFYCLIQKRNK